MARSSAYGYLKYGYESSYAGGNGSKTKVFGLEQKISGLSLSENRINLGALDQVELQSYAFGKEEGKMTVEWVLSNPWWLDALFHPYTAITGNPVNTAGEYAYTYISAPATLNDVTKLKSPTSMALEIGFAGESANFVRTINGAVLSQVSIRTAINEVVRVTGDLMWSSDVSGTSLDATPPTDNIGFAYTFVHGTLEVPNGTTIAQVQDVDLTINNNLELLWGIGSKNSVSAVRKTFDATGKFTCAVLDATQFANLVGRAEVATLKLTFSNGLSGTNEKSIVFACTGVGFGDHNTALPVPLDTVFQDLNVQIRSITVTSKNSNATPP